MRQLITLIITLFSFSIFGQQMTYEEWEKEAQSNIRLLPKYGNKEKTKGQKEADQEFIKTVLETDKTREKGSAHMIDLGFKYLYQDRKTAMYRFNQAYLLDSTNSDIYWGFGAIYFIYNRLDLAREQYQIGLEKDPDNSRILTDLGTTYMTEYFQTKNLSYLDTAISYLSTSYEKDPYNQNTLYKISSCYLMRNDCENAIKYYDVCMSEGGDPVTEEYKVAIKNSCK